MYSNAPELPPVVVLKDITRHKFSINSGQMYHVSFIEPGKFGRLWPSFGKFFSWRNVRKQVTASQTDSKQLVRPPKKLFREYFALNNFLTVP